MLVTGHLWTTRIMEANRRDIGGAGTFISIKSEDMKKVFSDLVYWFSELAEKDNSKERMTWLVKNGRLTKFIHIYNRTVVSSKEVDLCAYLRDFNTGGDIGIIKTFSYYESDIENSYIEIDVESLITSQIFPDVILDLSMETAETVADTKFIKDAFIKDIIAIWRE